MVFVIDTTLSMDPYIDRTRQVVGKLYDAIHAAGLSDKVSFGLVAYRNSVAKTPGLEYVSRVYANLEEGQDRDQFLNLIGNVKATTVSSHTFNEDAFSGIMTALDAKTGALIYEGGRPPVASTFMSSPVAYAGHLFMTNEEGDTFVITAGPLQAASTHLATLSTSRPSPK